MVTWILRDGLTVDEALWNSNIDYILANLESILPDPMSGVLPVEDADILEVSDA